MLFKPSRTRRAPGTGNASATSWSTSTRTRTGRSTCWCATWRSGTATSAWSAIRTSRSTSGAGADLRNILDFEDDFPETTVVRLERNYRSTQIILDAASGLIAHNRRRREKRLYTESAGGEPILLHRANDELEEADYILGRLRDAPAGRGGRAAVLFRTNAQSRVIEEALGRAGHPVPRGRRGPLLRTPGDQGRPRLPEAVAESRTTTSACAGSSTSRRAGSVRA